MASQSGQISDLSLEALRSAGPLASRCAELGEADLLIEMMVGPVLTAIVNGYKQSRVEGLPLHLNRSVQHPPTDDEFSS